jgi:O-antigen/teichoic acid export membrane protein
MPLRLIRLFRARSEFAWTFIWVSGARVAMLAGSLLGTVLIYRALTHGDPLLVQAGHFAIAMAVVRILTNCIGGASDLVVMRRLPLLVHSDLAAAGDVMRAALALRLGTWGLALGLALGFGPVFAGVFLDDVTESHLVLLMVAAAGGELLLRSVLSVFQAYERFDRFVIHEAAFQAARLAGVLALFLAGWMTVETILGFYAVAGLAVAALALRRVPAGLLAWRAVPRGVLRECGGFFLWTIAGYLLVAGTERVDLFLLSRFRGIEEVGLYGGVLTLAVIPDFIAGMLGTVLQPRVARLQASGVLAGFHRRLFLAMLPLAVLGMVLVGLLAPWLIGLTLGQLFVPAAPAFVLLAGASTVWLLLTPVPAVLISLSAPRTTMVLCMVQVVAVVSAGALLIPTHGAIGAALAVALTRMSVAVVVAIIGMRLMRRPPAAVAA